MVTDLELAVLNVASTSPRRHPDGLRFGLRTALSLVALLCMLLFGVRIVALEMCEVPPGAKARIEIGMERAEVIKLLGPPTGSQTSETCLDYDRPGALGWYAVYLDEEGRVLYVDDESM